MLESESAWFNKDTSNPIGFVVTIKLDSDECEKIFQKDFLAVLKEHKKDYNTLIVYRSIQTHWLG